MPPRPGPNVSRIILLRTASGLLAARYLCDRERTKQEVSEDLKTIAHVIDLLNKLS